MKQIDNGQNLTPRFVDVWAGQLTATPERLTSLLRILNDSERQKAQTFKFQALRDRFVMVRAALRQTLASYLDSAPADLCFEAGEYGKPHLACGSLHFNLSHTGDYLLIAVGNVPDIGIDIEAITARNSLDGIAKRVFSSNEFAQWQQLPPEQQLAGFYRLWTKKEAFVKAVGRGIALGMELCEFDLNPDGQLITIPSEHGSAADWRTIELEIANQVSAALLIRRCEFELRQYELAIN